MMRTARQPTVTRQSLVRFYDEKTRAIIDRYGPGPRIHYHTGIPDDDPPKGASREELRARLVMSQELLLEVASQVWDVRNIPFRDVLDMGCGLGGGAIFWAQEFKAEVTAVTIAPTHIGLIEQYARRAGVDSRIHPLLCDAADVPGRADYDAAIAIDSSSSFDRQSWFQALNRLLRDSGRIFIFDCFLGHPRYEVPFNRHWLANIGCLDEYLSDAREAGFSLEYLEDVSDRALHFWRTTLALMKCEAHESKPGHSPLEESCRIHALVQEGLLNGGLKHLLMSFVRV